MRAFALLVFAVFISVFPVQADPKFNISRRKFIISSGSCILGALTPSKPFSTSHFHHRSVNSALDVDILGLESFGRAVKELLQSEKYVVDQEAGEKIRWQLQEELWRRLKPKAENFVTSEVTSTVAIKIENNQYLYLDPKFRIEQVKGHRRLHGGRTVEKIEFMSDSSNPREFTYWIGDAPTDSSTIILGDLSSG
jgi:hypothetical protein